MNRWRAELERGEITDTDLRKRIEIYLDQNYGEGWLKKPRIADLVQETLLKWDGERYRLISWVIMPNHGHVLLAPIEGHTVADIMHSIKSFTAHAANEILSRRGQFWAKEYFDRYIRDQRHFANTITYIENNPVKAKLCKSPEQWPYSSAFFVPGENVIMKIITLFLFIVFVSMAAFAQTDEINIVPKPRTVGYGTGSFTLRKDTRIVLTHEAAMISAEILNDYFRKSYGFKLKIVNKSEDRFSSSKEQNAIIFLPVAIDASGGNANEIKGEKYSLNIEPDRIYIGGTGVGQFYAIQTFQQLIPVKFNKEIKIPVIKIADSPRFPYRGMHLDVGRHFMPVEFVKKYIDLMSQYKFNYFHWHLTEDQGWRIEIKKYPKLTEVGSKRPETMKEKNFTPYVGDGVPHEGFYTQEQIRDVVAYAKARFITVIPEIELPGHSSAAIAAYPELGCKADYKYEVQKTWGIFKEVYCPTEKTFSFLEDVLTEVIGLFPDSPYIHIGGDEVLKDMWKESPEVRELMARENLKDVNEVQSYFVRRMEKFINSKGKKIVGWDEILEGGLAPNATVMSWRGTRGGIEAARAHHDVIMTPTDYAYFDFAQGDPATEPINIGNYLTLEKVYSFDPVPKDLSPNDAKYIIGGQGNVWTEYMQTPEKVEYMLLPRMLAMAEDVWSTPENKNYPDFSRRLAVQLSRLDKRGVNFRIPEPTGLANRVLGHDEAVDVELKTAIPGASIHYTTDGTTPTAASPVIPDKLEIKPDGGIRTDLKTIVILPSGRVSSVYTATFLRMPWLGAEPDLKDKRQGSTFGLVAWRPDGIAEPLVTSGETKTLALQQFAKTTDLKRPFAVTFNGYFNAPVDAIYEFQIESTFSAALELDDLKLIGDVGTAERKIRSNVVPLKAGLHKIGVRYSNSNGEPFLRVRWAIKGQNWRNLAGGELVH